jgi:hypothetical protein
MCRYDQVVGLHCRRLHSSVSDVWRFSVISRVPVTASLAWPNTPSVRSSEGRNNRWQHRLNREHPTCTERANAHTRVRIEGWRQKRSSACKQSRSDRQGDEFCPNYTKTD